MDILTTRIFWGTLVMIIGLSLILNGVFKVNIPIFRIFFALVFIFIGISMLTGSFWFKKHIIENNEETILFSDGGMAVGNTLRSKYNVIFGKQELDFTSLTLDQNSKVEVNTIFGSQQLILPKNINARIRVSSAFGSAELPNGGNVVFGENIYLTPGFNEQEPVLDMKINVVFGSFELKYR